MSGRRPDTTKVWEFDDDFREENVGGTSWVTLPQYFKQYGYLTMGGGKLYHPNRPANDDQPLSWSPEQPYFQGSNQAHTCASQGPSVVPPHSPPVVSPPLGYAWCAVDTPKESAVLYDQQVRDNCLYHLELAKNATTVQNKEKRRPFFVGCGFHKPHAPHFAPKEFFESLADLDEIALPLDPFAPIGMPEVAWHPYADVSGMQESPIFNGTVNMTRLRVYRRAYYAAIAFQDYNIGVILDKLDSLGLTESTVVSLIGGKPSFPRTRISFFLLFFYYSVLFIYRASVW